MSDSCPIRRAIALLVDGSERPDAALLQAAFGQILAGEARPELMAAFLIGLRMRGETISDLVAGAQTMRAYARRIEAGDKIVDTCGTGGLGWASLNTSTASALLAAAGGVQIAKHGNRSTPPKTGSADVLEALGIELEASDSQLRECLDQVGLVFLFAPAHHGAMRHVASVRRSLGVRTIFNLLGPLSNPAGAKRQVLGVSEAKWVRPMAEALAELGAVHALVVHGIDGIDEISISGDSLIAELSQGEIAEYRINPADFKIRQSPLSSLRGGKPEDNAKAIIQVLQGQPGAFADAVALNAGAALYVGERAASMVEGVAMAKALLSSAAGMTVLERLQTHGGKTK